MTIPPWVAVEFFHVHGRVVDQVTALAQAPQVAQSVIRRIVIEVGGSQNHAGLTHARVAAVVSRQRAGRPRLLRQA
jgi:hypothetical protein